MNAPPFQDRAAAGRRLAAALAPLRDEDPVVLGLPRGGVVVACEVALALDAPLDVIIVRKLGVPFQPELGMGAIGEDGVRILNDRIVQQTGVTADELADVERRERTELDRRAARFRGGRPGLPLTGRTVIIVDDGVATGATARAACLVARARGAARIVLAVPWGRRRPSPSCGPSPTRSSPWSCTGTSTGSASSTPTSVRPPTRRSSPACSA